jgi:hypothetical protein
MHYSSPGIQLIGQLHHLLSNCIGIAENKADNHHMLHLTFHDPSHLLGHRTFPRMLVDMWMNSRQRTTFGNGDTRGGAEDT